MKYYHVEYANTEAYVDDYERGEIYEEPHIYNEILEKHRDFSTLAEVIEAVYKELYLDSINDVSKWEYVNGTLTTSTLVDEDNYEPSEEDIAQWKEGKRKLWGLDVFVNVRVIENSRDLTEEEARAEGIRVY